METYKPHPIDTSTVELPEDLTPLRELLAKNIHDNWAQQRINDGWIYGIARNDQTKHHPCLIPYEDLLDDEKDYDRLTVEQTLKIICLLGYKIVKSTDNE